MVDRGKGDGVYINTAGIGLVPRRASRSTRGAPRPGDAVLLSGSIAEHGIAILSVREGLEFESPIASDSAALHELVASLLDRLGADVHVLRDPTRGGVASVAQRDRRCGPASASASTERAIPVQEPVRGACEILGLDPLYVANEGKMVAVVAGARADEALAALRAHPLGANAAIVGEVTEANAGRVVLKSTIGGERLLDLLTGEQLPRIC